MNNKARLLALLAAIVVAAILRLVPHPPNFSPIAAMALFSGAYLGNRAIALIAPLAALLLSDAVLGFYPELLFVYASVAATVAIGVLLSRRRTPHRIFGAAVTGSVLFYLVTNFGVWLVSGIYPRTVEGLAACYAAAIPFFQNTLVGDLFFAALLFGGFALAERMLPSIRQQGAVRLSA